MTLYEKFWDCPACGRKGISALRYTKCPSCGYPKVPQNQEYLSNIPITDPDGIALARGGPHWTCSSCGMVNLNKYDVCQGCGNPRDSSDKTNRVVELGPISLPDRPDIDPDDKDGYIEELRLGDGGDTSNPVTSNSSPFPINSPYRQSSQLSVNLSGIHSMIVGLIAIIAIALLGYAIFHTKTVEARVVGFSWERTVTIEVYKTVHESGWSHPVDAYNIRSERKVRHHEPIYEERVVTVHHSRTCSRDLGNGAVETYDCSYDTTETERVKVGEKPVYDTWYEYDVDRWVYERTERASGNDRNPHWPNYTLNYEGEQVIGAERVGGRSESYIVYLESLEEESKIYEHRVSQDEWKQYVLGHTYLLKVNHLGVVVNNPLETIATVQP